jgi:hypothetical protein
MSTAALLPRTTDPRARCTGRPATRDDPRLHVRNLMWLGYVQNMGLTPAQIAEHEGVSPKTVRRGIAYAEAYCRSYAEAKTARLEHDSDLADD